MYSNTRFGELLKVFPKQSFARCVQSHQGDKHSKGFRCWDQLIAMMYAQLSNARSLRELETSFNSQSVYHYHLGSRPIKRSTLSDANAKRSARLYADFCTRLLSQTHGKLKREASDLLYLLDSTPICLTGRGFEWTQGHSQPHIPGLKLHVLYAPKADIPCQIQLTDSKVSDLEFGRELEPESGAMYVFDKGYCDYNWWYQLTQSGSYFVTRFKRNAALEQVQSRPIDSSSSTTIIADDIVRFKYKHPGGGRINRYDQPLRRIIVEREGHAHPLMIATNDLDRSAIQIADLYKQRWGIELWFKWLKQRLKIKQFLGRSDNAVRIQILIALITYLLIYQYRRLTKTKQSAYLWLAQLKTTLFERTNNHYLYYKKWHRRTNMKNEQKQVLLPI